MGAAECVGCLGDLKCWVCLGEGTLEVRAAVGPPCHRCNGTGICSLCCDLTAPRRPHVLDLRNLGSLKLL